MRPESLYNLLKTVEQQTKKPDEVLIVDSSTNNLTKEILDEKSFDLTLSYYKVPENERGLTKQRNYGIIRVSDGMDVVAFMDDDVEVDTNYFMQIQHTYEAYPDAIAVGGISTNEVIWQKVGEDQKEVLKFFRFDGWRRRDDFRYRLRKLLNLVSSEAPGRIVPYGHERSIGFLPPSGKTYEVNILIGMNMSYKI